MTGRPLAKQPFVAALVIILLLAKADQADAQTTAHRVRLAPRIEKGSETIGRWHPRPLETVVGTVKQFDADQISIEIEGQNVPTRFASHRVLHVESTSTPADQQKAISQLKEKSYHAALPALIRSISDHEADSRPPVWRQQWLSMLASQAAMRSGRGEIALELVGQLDARPLPAMMLGVLPIDWTGEIGNQQAMIDIAVKRASSDSPAVKLVTASWLLQSPMYRSAAESALRRLADQNERKWIAALARQVVWRTKSPPQIESSLRQWEDQIRDLPMVLRSGPMVCLLERVRRAGIKDAVKKWEMTLQLAPPTWHPELDRLEAAGSH